jgi:hypothetical protein
LEIYERGRSERVQEKQAPKNKKHYKKPLKCVQAQRKMFTVSVPEVMVYKNENGC